MLAASLAAWTLVRRHVRRVRAAERRARAAERMAEIGAMTGGLAHEIKNPLSTIGLNAQLLLEGIEDLSPPPPADQKARLVNRIRTLRREIERLTGILGDFLHYAGEVHLERAPTDLNTLIAELGDFYTPEAERHGVRLRVEPSRDGQVVVDADPRALKQAVLNLMLNAVQAFPPPPASLASSPHSDTAKPRELLLRTSVGKDHEGKLEARVHVIDTGPGIAPEAMKKLFEPYFTTKPGGSGLGLPTARRLVEAHGGRLDVRTELGVGTEFVVVLPMGEDRRGA